MLGDDYEPRHWPGVVRAVDEFTKGARLALNVYKNKWWVRAPVLRPPEKVPAADAAAPEAETDAGN